MVLSVEFAGSALVSFVVCVVGIEGIAEPLKLLAIILSMSSGAVLSHLVLANYVRRAIKHSEIIAILHYSVWRLKMTRTWRGLKHIATEAGEELIREVADCHSMALVFERSDRPRARPSIKVNSAERDTECTTVLIPKGEVVDWC